MILPTHLVAAGGIIFNDKNEVLLVKNPRKGWEFPGGIIEQGETIPQGLLREIKEETGVSVKLVNIVGIYSRTKKKKGYNGVKEMPTIVAIDFICEYVSGVFSTSEESSEIKWCSIEEALKIIHSEQNVRFQKALDYKKSFTCMGFDINSANEFLINEEYSFDR